MGDLEKYIEYWKKEVPLPKQFIIKRLFRKIWTAEKSEFSKLPEQEDQDHQFQDLVDKNDIAEIDREQQNELDTALSKEIKARIYSIVHHGTLIDHLMPVESRAFFSGRHCIKFAIIYILLIISIGGIFGWLANTYNVWKDDDVILKSYSGINSHLFNKRSAFSKPEKRVLSLLGEANTKINFEVKRDDKKPLYNLFTYSYVTACGLVDNNSISQSLVQFRDDFNIVKNEDLHNFITYVIFFHAILEDNRLKEHFIKSSKIVTNLQHNYLELMSQAVLVAIAIIFLCIFFCLKTSVYKTIRSVDSRVVRISFDDVDSKEVQLAMLNIYERLILKNYKNRKLFHYLLAVFSSSLVIALHVIMAEKGLYSVGLMNATNLGLVPYDYRISTDTNILFLFHWALQFVIIYVIVLTGWEIKQLKTVQKEMLRIINKNDDTQETISTPVDIKSYWLVGYGLLSFALIGQVVVSALKLNGYVPHFNLFDLNQWFYYFYIFSPPGLIVFFLFFIFSNNVLLKRVYLSVKAPEWVNILKQVRSELPQSKIIDKLIEYFEKYESIKKSTSRKKKDD